MTAANGGDQLTGDGGLDVSIRPNGDGVITVSICGEIDPYSADAFADALLEAATSADAAQIELDLAGVQFMDSSGLRALLVAGDDLTERGTRLSICMVSEPVRRLLEITDLADRFDVPR
jgi:anti-anti-sigma factor